VRRIGWLGAFSLLLAGCAPPPAATVPAPAAAPMEASFEEEAVCAVDASDAFSEHHVELRQKFEAARDVACQLDVDAVARRRSLFSARRFAAAARASKNEAPSPATADALKQGSLHPPRMYRETLTSLSAPFFQRASLEEVSLGGDGCGFGMDALAILAAQEKNEEGVEYLRELLDRGCENGISPWVRPSKYASGSFVDALGEEFCSLDPWLLYDWEHEPLKAAYGYLVLASLVDASEQSDSKLVQQLACESAKAASVVRAGVTLEGTLGPSLWLVMDAAHQGGRTDVSGKAASLRRRAGFVADHPEKMNRRPRVPDAGWLFEVRAFCPELPQKAELASSACAELAER